MGLLTGTDQQYYEGDDLGNYQFTSLEDIINQFIIAYVGEGKIISKTNMTSTRGVVLIVPIISSSSSEPTLIPIMFAPDYLILRLTELLVLISPLNKTACKSEPNERTFSITALLRRVSQL